jgi:hypothetical protein
MCGVRIVWRTSLSHKPSLTQTLPHKPQKERENFLSGERKFSPACSPVWPLPFFTHTRRRRTSSRARGSFPLLHTFIYILPTLRHNTRREKNLLNAFSYPLPTLRHRRGKTSSRARGSFPLRTHLHFATRNPHTKHKKKGKLPLGREEVF